MERALNGIKAWLDRESLLELGLAGFLLLLLSGLSLLVVSWALASAQRVRRRGQGPPDRGSVPDSRHQHIGAASPR